MTYQVLARKWRPQNFSSLVGQEPIVTALRNALQEGRILLSLTASFQELAEGL